jgi:cell division protein FtsI/penicillin-binding protein 2
MELTQDRWRVRWTLAVVAPELVAAERLVLTRMTPRRGDVLGDGDNPLVTARPVVRLGIDKTKVAPEQTEASARALADLVDVDAAAYGQRVVKSGPKAFVEAVVLRVADAPQPTAYAGIEGAVAIDDELPLPPTRDFARPVLGTVGAATAELVKDSGGRLQPGDVTGLSGLQKRYDVQLRGRPGVVVRAVTASVQEGSGATERELFRTEPVDGTPLATTLDERLQRLAESTLAHVRPASAIVAVRPSDGHLLAAASGPGSRGLSTATAGRFAPGSTFKVVTSLGLLRAGLSASTTVSCPATITVDGRRFKNYDDYPSNRLGPVTLRTAVANSCNTAMIGQRAKVPQPDLAAAAAALGLGVDHDLGYPVFLGAVPTDAGATEHAASMIGQGKVEASPVAMAAVAASVARGATVTPQLLQDPPESPDQPSVAVTKQQADAVRSLMRAVVTEGSGRFLATLPGPPVAAKTGTAEFGTDSPPQTHAWMIAVQGDLAVAVFVDLGTSGSGTAGPLLERFLRGS